MLFFYLPGDKISFPLKPKAQIQPLCLGNGDAFKPFSLSLIPTFFSLFLLPFALFYSFLAPLPFFLHSLTTSLSSLFTLFFPFLFSFTLTPTFPFFPIFSHFPFSPFHLFHSFTFSSHFPYSLFLSLCFSFSLFFSFPPLISSLYIEVDPLFYYVSCTHSKLFIVCDIARCTCVNHFLVQ
ncbi:unnamed protein product [Acanthosepion pharaonis]|uniref:Uncharacterized protein n=1 Tax=Acanthosepion pharaonis TaxID=158019 RepID=A0A812C1G1_ACAPH|nr:unnamed protein product [Sepia pharaonis]